MHVAIEAEKTMVKTMPEAAGESRKPTTGIGHISTVERMRPRAVRLSLKQPTFDWATKQKYTELKNL